ncbi:predicted protein [Uncinocarpus reesii 1704]|uniref:Bud22 domain-containing protein n=1 Tax=Uncinocarpus reesii (strain UAMH 1704) TaxID=336963 RepID=C4JH34_UNCRE|nr:uncharacterized protein UREG_01285 [Uncinocarpus reesii 1704]EEP76436.1 predicted protein [Uncinocarpus reesii 1704]
MPKRKREDVDENPASNPEPRKLTLRATRLEQKIEQGIQQVHRALKTARGFERQKLGRRQKNAQSKNETAQLSRLSEEVQALKSLDLSEISRKYVIKQLVKTKRIADSPVFAQLEFSKQNVFDGKKDGPEANVMARLFSSNPVKTILPGIMDGIRGILGVDDAAISDKKTAASQKTSKTPATAGPLISKTPLQMDSHSSDQEDTPMGEAESTSEFAQFDDLIASSSGSESEGDYENIVSGKKDKAYDPVEDFSLSPTPSVTDSDSPPATALKSSKPSKPSGKASTTFLPSLTMGGYWSGTESEAEDNEAASAIAPRKNRMGQQARRKLWEKKFGANANHVRKQGEGNNRDSGWDMRRGATSNEGRGRDSGGGGRLGRRSKDESGPYRRGEGAGRMRDSIKRGQDQDQKPLHPSWEAAKRAKEQKAQANFQGKKVVFD